MAERTTALKAALQADLDEDLAAAARLPPLPGGGSGGLQDAGLTGICMRVLPSCDLQALILAASDGWILVCWHFSVLVACPRISALHAAGLQWTSCSARWTA